MLPELFGIFLLGMVNGMTVCSLSCMPVLGSYLIITGNGFGDGVVSAFSFTGGKTVAYTLLGGLAALFGTMLSEAELPYVKIVFGTLLVAAGLSIPFIEKVSCVTGCSRKIRRVSLFSLGLSSGFVPCPSLAAIFLIAATKTDVISGASCGLVYGLGLAVSPILLIGGLVGRISEILREKAGLFVPVIQIMSILILVGLGFQMMSQEI